MSKDDKITVFHVVEDYLNKNYDLRFNSISLEIEISQKAKNDWNPCNENSLWIEIQKKGIKMSLSTFITLLKSNFIKDYNPIKNYFYNLPKWDGKTDYITMFSRYIILDEHEDKEQFEYHFKKWCVRAVKCATIDDYFNKQAFILTDNGEGQNIGKTSWCRFLCPDKLAEFIAQDIPDQEKDARILFAKNFLVNLDELASLSRKEINKLKSYFTLDKINERLPYDKKNSILPRISSFLGSTNMSTFLHDETGSVRWLCFVVKKINWEYKNHFNIDDLWSQAFHLSKDKNFIEILTSKDIIENENRNQKFQIITPEKELIMKYFEVPENDEDVEHFTSTEILQKIASEIYGIRLNTIAIGKAMKSLGFKNVKHKNIYCYKVKSK
ncbi:MAG: virulence-associated E family protein [Flavobacteriales bacterium]|nr:virulence-associated E family protein [Flavobacteriales bacterium]